MNKDENKLLKKNYLQKCVNNNNKIWNENKKV